MNKLKKIVIILIMINIMFVNLIGFFQNAVFAANQTISTEISKIDDNKYPGIKDMIQDLQKKFPNWTFKVVYTGINFDDAIAGEHNSHGRSLVTASHHESWICDVCKDKAYDSGSWRCASVNALKYMMDPRASINEDDVFQFLQLSYVDTNYNDLQSMVKNYGYLNQKSLIENVIKIGKEKNVNPFFIMAKIIQEQGKGSSVLVTGKSFKGTDGVTYSGYYNYFNVGAYGSGAANVITKGLKYAKNKGWTTPEKSIEGGIATIADNYIKYGQDTMYFQKFNVTSTKYSFYTHQYMQNILGAQNEGKILRDNLYKNGLMNQKYTFIIPLYENTPATKCLIPTKVVEETTTTRNADEPRKSEENNDVEISEEGIKIDKEGKGVTVVPGMTVKQILEATGSKEIKNAKGEVIKETDSIGTGYTVGDYTIVVMGDVNGDGKINSGDSLILSKEVLKTMELSDESQKQASDVNCDGKINSGDTLILRKHILGTYKISINKGE